MSENNQPVLTRKAAQKIETRRLILASSHKLFQERGYEATTMRALAKECNVGLGTLFKHFEDKSAILTATFEDEVLCAIEQAFNNLPEQGIYQQFRHILNSLYGYYARNIQLSRVLAKEALFMQASSAKTLHAQTMTFLGKIADLLAQAAQRNEIKPIHDMQQAVLAFWSFYLLGLIVGLREDVFHVAAQTEMVDGLLKANFTL